MNAVLIDAGPIVALIDSRDRCHPWVRSQFSQIKPPLMTCEAVLSEAFFLIQTLPFGTDSLIRLLEKQVIEIQFSVADEFDSIATLMRKYANVPMSLADATLVRMSELVPDSVVLTLDSDFLVYRRNRREPIPVLIPDELR